MTVETVSTLGPPGQAGPLPATLTLDSRMPGKTEALLAGALALTAYTALLLRLPYRSMLINAFLGGLALTSFYLYVRLRLHIRLPLKVLLCLVLSIVMDVIGNQFGLFSRRIALVPYDIITHFTVSGLSFVPIMWLMTTLLNRSGYRLPPGLVAFFSLTTTFSLAAYYEITELIDERLLDGHRIWTPRDTVQDLAADLAGIFIAMIVYILAVRRQRRLS